MRVVVDTNTVVSGLARSKNPPAQIMELWRLGIIELLSSRATMRELDRVLRYPKVRRLTKLTDNEIQAFLALYHRDTTVLQVTLNLEVVPGDPDDNMFIALAVTGNADYLITGDRKHLLPLERHEDILIVSPAHFMALIQETQNMNAN